MGGKSSQQTGERTVTQDATIPDFLRPFIEQSAGVAGGALGGLQSILGNAQSSDLVSGFNSDQTAGFDLARSLALGPDSPFATATNQLASTASGEGFQSDAFNDAFGAIVRRQQPGVISPFIAAGRGTGGLADVALGQSQSDAFAGLFNQERGRQLNSALALPGVASSGLGLLSSIGGQQQQQSQRELSAPLNALQSLLGSSLGGLPISSLIGQSQTTPIFENKGAQTAGLLSTGLGLAGSLFGGPIGGFLGGSLGGGLSGIGNRLASSTFSSAPV